MRPNWSLSDMVRDYWDIRAASYDASLGHGAISGPEAKAWADLIGDHLGPGDGRAVLEPGCGTGPMLVLLDRLGFRVTGADFSDAMLDHARPKVPGARFWCAEATRIPEADASFDAILARNLVWTLPDPAAALAEWRRLLRPGGRLLIIDGDFVRLSVTERLMPLLDRLLGPRQDGHSALTDDQWRAHHAILAKLPHGDGLRADDVRRLMTDAGFTDLRQQGLNRIIAARHPSPLSRARWIARSQHRFAISGRVA